MSGPDPGADASTVPMGAFVALSEFRVPGAGAAAVFSAFEGRLGEMVRWNTFERRFRVVAR